MCRFLIITLLALMMSACANVSRFEKNSLVAFGQLLDTSNEPLYYLIRMDLKKSVDLRIMSSQIKLSPDGPPIAIGEMQEEVVASYLPLFISPPQWPDAWKLKAKEQQVYAGNGFNIAFKEGQLVFVGICSLCAEGREAPVVGTPDSQHFYTLPMTLRQVIEVFGQPDRIYKVNEVRY